MINRTDIYFEDARDQLRVKESRRVNWQTQGGEVTGKGKVRNISSTGMLLETNSTFTPTDHQVFRFDADLGQNNFIPQTGRLVWHKRKNTRRNNYLCGIQFVEPADFVLDNLEKRVLKRSNRKSQLRYARRGADVLLTAGILGLTGFVLWLSTDIYQGMDRSNVQLLRTTENQAELTRTVQTQLSTVTEELNATKALYAESELMLEGVSKELEATQAILAETEKMLTQVRQDNSQLRNEVQSVKTVNERRIREVKAELEATIALLQDKNTQLTKEMVTVQAKLDFYEGNIKNTEEGAALIALYHDKLKEVRKKIRHFEREARSARKAASKERDQLLMALGNNGFFMKNGETVKVDQEKYNAAANQPLQVGSAPDRQVEVNVTFVE